jgi:hypothetical protein
VLVEDKKLHREAFEAVERLPVWHRGTFESLQRLPVQHREAFEDSRSVQVQHLETFANLERLPARHREAFERLLRLPVRHRETFATLERLPARHREAFERPLRLPVRHREAFVNLERVPVQHRAGFEGLRRLPVRHREAFQYLRCLPVTRSGASGRLRLGRMGETTKPARRAIAALNHPEYEVPLFITQARRIAQSVKGNPWFSDPSPPLATIETAIEELASAETATLSRTKGTVDVRDAKRLALVQLLQQLMRYVQTVADANVENAASIIEGGGFSLQKPGGRRPRQFAAKEGPLSGTVMLVAPKIPGATAYQWGCGTDGGETYFDLPTTSQGSTIVSGLRPGSTVYFRYRPVTRKGDGDWSQPVSIVVV